MEFGTCKCDFFKYLCSCLYPFAFKQVILSSNLSYILSAESTTLISPKFYILNFFHQLTQYWLIATVGKNISLEVGNVI